MKEKIIKVKPKNVYDICKFLDETYFHTGYGGGLNATEKIYLGGISFKSTNKSFYLENSPVKYEIIIKNQRNFDKDSLNKLIEIARN